MCLKHSGRSFIIARPIYESDGCCRRSLEQWLWDAACSIRGAKDAPKYKDYILPLVFAKRLCDVFDDEINRIAQEVGGRTKALKLVARDKKLVRFYIPLQPANADEPVWSIICKLADKIGEQLTTTCVLLPRWWRCISARTS